jgi:hypothetical protein
MANNGDVILYNRAAISALVMVVTSFRFLVWTKKYPTDRDGQWGFGEGFHQFQFVKSI